VWIFAGHFNGSLLCFREIITSVRTNRQSRILFIRGLFPYLPSELPLAASQAVSDWCPIIFTPLTTYSAGVRVLLPWRQLMARIRFSCIRPVRYLASRRLTGMGGRHSDMGKRGLLRWGWCWLEGRSSTGFVFMRRRTCDLGDLWRGICFRLQASTPPNLRGSYLDGIVYLDRYELWQYLIIT
jgi:hypothetical protein